MRSIGLVLSLVVALLCQTASASTKPNFILIYSDDHGYADLGIHGIVGDVRTPNLDALGRSGAVIRNGYSTAPQCVPSRGGLMTGKFQGRFNLDNNRSSLEGFNKETTIATRLQKAGYATAQFGKWHLGPANEIPNHGFRHVFSQHSQGPFAANITLEGKDQPMTTVRAETYHIEGCSRAAASTIDRYRNEPFFLYIAFRAPHTPLDAPAKYTARFPGPMPERRRQALAMLSAIDDGVGLITQTLAKHSLTERTLLFFIGDNGAPLKIHKIDSPLDGDAGGWDGSLNTPLNGEKGMLSEGGMHVPFLVAWPGTIPGGQTYSHPVSALDVAATFAAAADIKVNAGDFDGVNLVPHLKGEIKSPPHEALMWRWSAQCAIREDNWKLLRGGDREYLYDLSADLGEKQNLASKHPDVADRLRGKLTAWAGELNPPGLALEPMSKVWSDYFDHYLEGKTIPPPAPGSAASEAQGWIARNGSLVDEAGILRFTPEQRKPGFITRSDLNVRGPAKLSITLKSATAGAGAVAWRLPGDKDFLPANRTSFQIAAGADWQSHDVSLPASGAIIHVRVHLPAGPISIRQIQLQHADR
jgi:arylsulfatase A-like enzyme